MLFKLLVTFALVTTQANNSTCFSPSAILTNQQLTRTEFPIEALPDDVAIITQVQQVKFYCRAGVRAVFSADRKGQSDPSLQAKDHRLNSLHFAPNHHAFRWQKHGI